MLKIYFLIYDMALREEEIIDAAFLYSKESSDNKPCSDAIFIGFIEGSMWSDKHYKDSWNDPKEPPEEKVPILIYRNGKSKYSIGDNSVSIIDKWDDWDSAVSGYGIISWAYIKNLLPWK